MHWFIIYLLLMLQAEFLVLRSVYGLCCEPLIVLCFVFVFPFDFTVCFWRLYFVYWLGEKQHDTMRANRLRWLWWLLHLLHIHFCEGKLSSLIGLFTCPSIIPCWLTELLFIRCPLFPSPYWCLRVTACCRLTVLTLNDIMSLTSFSSRSLCC